MGAIIQFRPYEHFNSCAEMKRLFRIKNAENWSPGRNFCDSGFALLHAVTGHTDSNTIAQSLGQNSNILDKRLDQTIGYVDQLGSEKVFSHTSGRGGRMALERKTVGNGVKHLPCAGQEPLEAPVTIHQWGSGAATPSKQLGLCQTCSPPSATTYTVQCREHLTM